MRCFTSEDLVVLIEVLLMPLFGAKLFDNDEEGIFSSTLTKLRLSAVSTELSAVSTELSAE